jgi:hypothetical protein
MRGSGKSLDEIRQSLLNREDGWSTKPLLNHPSPPEVKQPEPISPSNWSRKDISSPTPPKGLVSTPQVQPSTPRPKELKTSPKPSVKVVSKSTNGDPIKAYLTKLEAKTPAQLAANTDLMWLKDLVTGVSEEEKLKLLQSLKEIEGDLPPI